MEKSAAIDVQTPAAEAPIRTQQEVEAEDPMLAFGEGSAACVATVRAILLILSPVAQATIFAYHVLECCVRKRPFCRGAFPEFAMADPENGSKNAITGNRLTAVVTHA